MMASIIMPYTTYKGWYSNAPMDTEYVITEKSGQTNEKNGFIRVNGNYEMYLWRKFVALSQSFYNAYLSKLNDYYKNTFYLSENQSDF